MPPRRSGNAAVLKKTVVATAVAFLVGLLVLSMPIGARVLFDGLQIYPPVVPSALTADIVGTPAAIVILSAGLKRNATEFGAEFSEQALDGLSLERLRYGVFLARKTGLPILVSGGLPLPEKPPLAELMATTLETDYGMSAKWIENRSVNTAENAIFSAVLLKKAGIGHIVLVTHAWHMKRAVASFVANGIIVTAAPTAFYMPGRGPIIDNLTPSITTLHMSNYAMHEVIGSLWYGVRYGY